VSEPRCAAMLLTCIVTHMCCTSYTTRHYSHDDPQIHRLITQKTGHRVNKCLFSLRLRTDITPSDHASFQEPDCTCFAWALPFTLDIARSPPWHAIDLCLEDMHKKPVGMHKRGRTMPIRRSIRPTRK